MKATGCESLWMVCSGVVKEGDRKSSSVLHVQSAEFQERSS